MRIWVEVVCRLSKVGPKLKKKKLKKVCGNDHEQNEVLLPMASMASGAEVFLLHLMLSNGLKTSVLLQIKLPVMTPSG